MNPLGVVATILGGIILLGGAVKALPAVWTFIKAASKAPVMVERMYAEFSPNSGSSLRDAVDAIQADLSGVKEWRESYIAEDMERLSALAEHDAQVSEYLHTRMHQVLGAITPIVAWPPIFDKRLERIEEQLRITAEEAKIVAADLVEAKEAVQGVADDLAAERDGILRPPNLPPEET